MRRNHIIFMEAFRATSAGSSVRNKIIILISLFIYSVFRFIPRHFQLLKRSSYAYYGEFILKDVTVKNEDGIFYCRKRSADCPVVSPTYEKEIREYFGLNKGIFIDVGAHIGKYTIMMCKRLDNQSKVIALEPDPDNYKVLLRNILLNDCKDITPLNVGLWKEKDKLNLYGFGNKNTGGRSVVVSTSDFKVIIEVDTLDNVLKKLGVKKVDLIKIDVEGAEVEVLEGAKETLKQKPKIIFECWSEKNLHNIQNILKEYRVNKTAMEGYYFAYVDNAVNRYNISS